MRPLTARQQEVLDLLKRHLETTGMPPTRAESLENWDLNPQCCRRTFKSTFTQRCH